MKKFLKKKYMIPICLVLAFVVILIIAEKEHERRQALIYKDSLDKVAAEVNGTKLTLEDLAFYVYFKEAEVDRQAVLYNPENPNQYWGLHTDGQFIKFAARDAALQLAIHDEIFYQMAMEEGITLTEEELAYLANNQADVWSDMTEDGKEVRLGVTQEQIKETMEKMAYAQKYQTIYALLHNVSFEDYDIGEEVYQELLDQQDYKVNKKVWEKISFGKITLDYEVEEEDGN